MPKKIKFECFKYRFLIAAQNNAKYANGPGQPCWEDFIRTLKFSYEKGVVGIDWKLPTPGSLSLSLEEPEFYVRGDNDRHIARQRELGLMAIEDPIKLKNNLYFKEIVMRVVHSAGYKIQ